jgi:hypothetical protein
VAGPLQSGRAGAVGGNSLYPPRGEEVWAGTFGGYTLCTRGGVPVTLRRVSWQASQPPRRLELYVRSVPDGGGDIPIGSALGMPPRFAEPYADGPVAGTFSSDVAGTVVRRPCGKPIRAGDGFTELLFTLHVGPAGAAVVSATIHYTARNEDFALPLTWQMVACGTKVDPKVCPS